MSQEVRQGEKLAVLFGMPDVDDRPVISTRLCLRPYTYTRRLGEVFMQRVRSSPLLTVCSL